MTNSNSINQMDRKARSLHPKMPRNYFNIFFASEKYIFEYSTKLKKIIYEFDKYFDSGIYSIEKTKDNQFLFVSENNGKFYQIDIRSKKLVKGFKNLYINQFLITCDSKFLIAPVILEKDTFVKWSMKSKKTLHTWKGSINRIITTLACTHNSKFLLVGYKFGSLSIFNLENYENIHTCELNSTIFSIVITQDNQQVYLSEFDGTITKLDLNTLEENSQKTGDYLTSYMCLSKNDKKLLIVSENIIKVFNLETLLQLGKFEMAYSVRNVVLVNDGLNAIIASENGEVINIDLEKLVVSLQIDSIRENAYLRKIAVV